MATPKQTDPQFKLRMPQVLKDKIDMAASESNRSLNAEIISRLSASFESKRFMDPEVERVFTRGIIAGVLATLIDAPDPIAAMKSIHKAVSEERTDDQKALEAKANELRQARKRVE